MSRFALALGILVFAGGIPAQDNTARQIVAKSENRSRSKSQQYEGTLEVIGASNRVSIKRWEYRRIGSFGASKAILRFTAPAEVKGVALLIVNHTDRASDQWMWTPAIERDRRIAWIGKARAAVKDRLTKEIAYWDHRAEELKLQERAGKPNARLNSNTATANTAALTALPSRSIVRPESRSSSF